MEFNKRLRAMRTQASLTQKELGKLLGVSEVTVRNWETGTKFPSMNAIIALSKVLSTSADVILGLEPVSFHGMPTTKEEARLLSEFRTLDLYGQRAVSAVCAIEKARINDSKINKQKIVDFQRKYIPKYATPSAAGFAVPIDGEEYELIPVDDSVPSGADFATEAHGDSMEPYIHDGETVFVKKDCELNIGDVGIFIVNGARYCKQYYIDENRNLTLVSANPKLRGSNVYISAESNVTVMCCGKVLLPEAIPLPDYFLDE